MSRIEKLGNNARVHRSLHTRPHQQVRAVDAYESWHEVILAPLVESRDVVCTQQDQRQGGAIHTSMETSVRGARYSRTCSTVHVDARLKGSMAPKCAFLGSQGIPVCCVVSPRTMCIDCRILARKDDPSCECDRVVYVPDQIPAPNTCGHVPSGMYAHAVMVTAWMRECPGGEHLCCSQ